jgi:hypothetical protein
MNGRAPANLKLESLHPGGNRRGYANDRGRSYRCCGSFESVWLIAAG